VFHIPYLNLESGSPYSPSRIVGPKADKPFDEKDIKVASCKEIWKKNCRDYIQDKRK
jgi:hypothetical protein